MYIHIQISLSYDFFFISQTYCDIIGVNVFRFIIIVQALQNDTSFRKRQYIRISKKGNREYEKETKKQRDHLISNIANKFKVRKFSLLNRKERKKKLYLNPL